MNKINRFNDFYVNRNLVEYIKNYRGPRTQPWASTSTAFARSVAMVIFALMLLD
jgi:hypothetical protein